MEAVFCVFALFFESNISRFSSFKSIEFWREERVGSVKPLKRGHISCLEKAVDLRCSIFCICF